MQIELPVLKVKEFLQRTSEKEMHRCNKLIPVLISGHHIM